jgi:hypothetical protein
LPRNFRKKTQAGAFSLAWLEEADAALAAGAAGASDALADAACAAGAALAAGATLVAGAALAAEAVSVFASFLLSDAPDEVKVLVAVEPLLSLI